MHPMMQGRLRTALYLGVWVGVGALLTGVLVLIEPRPAARMLLFVGPITLVFASVCLSAYYVARTHPLATTAPTSLVARLSLAAAQAAFGWVVIGAAWAGLLASADILRFDRAELPRLGGVLFVLGFVLYAQSLAAHYFLIALDAARAIERRLLESQVTAREAELRALRAQIHPHFLFNSLNSISALTGSQPEAARRMCQLLGEFLRASLGLGGRERVAVAEELALADTYLAIEQVRFGERLEVDRAVEAAAARCLVPPLIIQPLVENAVKHGVADRVEGGRVSIAARRAGSALELSVENPYDPEAPPRRGQGLGLENVRQRLAALDPRTARLDVHRAADRFRVVLTLPAIDGHDGV